MRRDSRHKSHRSHKHSSRDARGRSDSEDDGSSRDRRQREEEVAGGAGARVSRDVDEDRRKGSSSVHASQEKDRHGAESGDVSAERSGKRKEREEESCTPERWSGGGKEDVLTEKGNRKEDLGPVHYQKAEKSTPLTVETKSRSNRRREGSLERYGDSSARSESAKRRSEKEHSRRDSRDEKERDIERGSDREKERDRAAERDKKSQDYRHRRSDDAETRTQSTRKLGAEDERTAKKDIAELDKDSERYSTKKKSGSNSTDKWHDDGRNNDDKRLSSRDDIKNESHKVEGHKDEHYKDDRYREKYYRDADRDQRHRDSRHREERYSRDYTSDRLDSKSKDREKPTESYSKKSKLHGSEREVSPHGEDHGVKSRDSRAQKRSYDEIDDYDGLKQKSSKEPRTHGEKNSSNSSKLDHRYQGKDDASHANNLSKRSVSPKARSSKDHSRRGSKQSEYGHKEPVPDDRMRATEERDKVSMDHERASDSFSSDKMKVRDRMNSDDREHVSVSQSPFKRGSHFSSGSPVQVPQPPMRHSVESPSVYGDDNRTKSADRRANHYKRMVDPSVERGQGMTWKNGPAWPAAVPNGFIPFQHGPPAHGFHSAMQHFPPPSLFGARPYMEMNQPGFPYMHESDRFSAHGHPFGWHSTDDSCPPQLQGWEGNSSLFGDKAKVLARPDWDPNRHLMGGRGWDLSPEMWKGQNPNLNAETSAAAHEFAEKTWAAYPIMQPKSSGEEERIQLAQDGTAHSKQLGNSPDNNSREVSLDMEQEKAQLPCKADDRQNPCNYLSKIEISFDLIQPDLCEEIRNLLMPRDPNKEEVKNNGVQMLAKTPSFGSMLLPANADAAFKRAMSVYWKQNHGKKPRLADDAAFRSKQEKTTAHAADWNDPKAVSALVPPPPELLPGVAGPLEEDEKGSAAQGRVEDSCDEAGDGNPPCPGIAPGVVLVQSSGACDGVMPDCKVSLNRIHNPPESTH